MAIRRQQRSTARGRGVRPGSSRTGTRSLRAQVKKSRTTPSRSGTAARRGSARRTGGATRGRSARTTTDHNTIQRWAESRGGVPSTVSRTARGGQRAGILRIDFPGYSGKGTLKRISWDEWFRKFDESNLSFLYQDKTAGGKTSRFFKLVERE